MIHRWSQLIQGTHWQEHGHFIKKLLTEQQRCLFPFEPLAKTPTSLGSRASIPGALRSKSVSRRMSVYRSSDAWLDNMRNAVASVGWKLENLKRYMIYSIEV